MDFKIKFIAEPKYYISLFNKLMFSHFIIVLLVLFSISISQAQWKKVNLPAGFESSFLLDIQFLSTNPYYGWACGYDGVVLRTTDMGNSWSGTLAMPSKLQLESIHFVNENVGYTSGTDTLTNEGKILKSIDGGRNWTDVTPIFTTDQRFSRALWGCYFLNENLGVVLGGDCDLQFIFKTTDGGSNWAKNTYSISNTKLSDAILYNDGSGWAVSSGVLWITSDFADNWETYASTGGRDWQEELTYLDGSFLLPYDIECYGSKNNSGGARFIYNDEIRQKDLSSSMYGAFLMSKESGWVCGSWGSIYFTSDAGVTWELTNCGIENKDHLDDIWFINDTLGFIAGQGIYRTARLDIPKPEIITNVSVMPCLGEEIELRTNKTYSYYEWSTGEKQRTIKVDSSGYYSVFAFNSKCDSGTAEIYVQFLEPPDFEFLADTPGPYCDGDTLILTVEPDSINYIWADGSTSQTISVTSSGTYEVTGVGHNGCKLTKAFEVNFNPTPKPIITSSRTTSFCIGDSVYLETIEGMAEYKWFHKESNSFISNQRVINVKDSGTYYVEVINDYGCTGISESITVNVRQDTNQLLFSFNYPDNIFDFDSVTFPDMVCRTLEITNISGRRAEIHQIFLALNISFSIPPAQYPLILMPRETKSIEICYTPRKIDVERDTLVLPDNCLPHVLPLVAVGKGKTFTGKSDCNVDISLITIGLDGKEFYYVSAPFPNPAADILQSSFVIFGKDNTISILNSSIYDAYGGLISKGVLNTFNVVAQNGGELSTGDITFDVADLSPGIYFVVIISNQGSSSYPVVISR